MKQKKKGCSIIFLHKLLGIYIRFLHFREIGAGEKKK